MDKKTLEQYMNIVNFTVEDLVKFYIHYKNTNTKLQSELMYEEIAFKCKDKVYYTLYLLPEYNQNSRLLAIYALLFIADKKYEEIAVHNSEYNEEGYSSDEECEIADLDDTPELEEFVKCTIKYKITEDETIQNAYYTLGYIR